jgi:hypothetical protein
LKNHHQTLVLENAPPPPFCRLGDMTANFHKLWKAAAAEQL